MQHPIRGQGNLAPEKISQKKLQKQRPKQEATSLYNKKTENTMKPYLDNSKDSLNEIYEQQSISKITKCR